MAMGPAVLLFACAPSGWSLGAHVAPPADARTSLWDEKDVWTPHELAGGAVFGQQTRRHPKSIQGIRRFKW